MLLILASVAAHALKPSCTVTWEDLRAGGKSAPGGATVLGSELIAGVDDGESVRPLIRLPGACALGSDGPRSQVGGDKLVVLDRAAPALTRHA